MRVRERERESEREREREGQLASHPKRTAKPKGFLFKGLTLTLLQQYGSYDVWNEYGYHSFYTRETQVSSCNSVRGLDMKGLQSIPKMGGCQNNVPFLGPLYNTAPSI